MRFDTFGPFSVQVTDRQILRSQSQFWADVDYEAVRWGHPEGSLATAIGCYALVMFNRSYKPWYVGKTVAKAGFKGEVFQEHKLSIYTEYVAERRGRPYMFLFPLLTEGGKFSGARSSASDVIDWLEKTLIGMAFAKNPLLRHVASTKHLRSVTVSGLLGPRPLGRPNTFMTEARQAFLATPKRSKS